jgi:hypothetical protein
MRLTEAIKDGVLLIGLGKLINGGGPGFIGHYRIVKIGAITAIEFFKGAVTSPDKFPVKILPYVPNSINVVGAGGDEVISGEFTGCVMSLFRHDGLLKCAHVDTNKDTSQRKAYETLKGSTGFQLIAEYDTTGKLAGYPGLQASTIILCVAGMNAITHYFVDRELHAYSGLADTPGAGFGAPKTFGKITETRYHVKQSFGH